jgi:hypothetical protein
LPFRGVGGEEASDMPVTEENAWEDAESSVAGLTSVSAPPTGPGPSSDALVQSTEPQPATDDGVESESQVPDPLPEFDPKYRRAFDGLLYLGKLTDSFEWLGHTFTIRTMTANEVLEIGLIHAPYVGTMAEVKAYQALVVAACVVEVDGRPLVIPLTDAPEDTPLRNRFRYVIDHWYPPTLDAIYERFLLLEKQASDVIGAMDLVSG